MGPGQAHIEGGALVANRSEVCFNVVMRANEYLHVSAPTIAMHQLRRRSISVLSHAEV
jgi:hypothetical protein